MNHDERLSPRLATAAVVFLAALLAVAALDSLRWPYIHDSPLMLYAGWLVAQGAVPYRDLFDMNMPGTYFVMWALGSLFGWSELAFRTFDLVCVSIIAIATFQWLRPLGRLPGFAAALFFPLWYLHAGPSMSVQREFLALVPLAVLLALTSSAAGSWHRLFVIGALVGVSVLIKPQFLLLAALPVVWTVGTAANRAGRLRSAVIVFGGFCIPLVATGLYLAYSGGLRSFLDVAINYWPLYTRLNGSHEVMGGVERMSYLARSTWEGLLNPYLPLGFLGIATLLADPTRKTERAWLMSGLLIAGALYPALSGQFWSYHWIPLHYLSLCGAALAFRRRPSATWRARDLAGATVAVLAVVLVSAGSVNALVKSWTGDPGSDVVRSRARAAGVPQEVGEYLRSHLNPGDVVQPLDWTGGAVHAMMMARARLATRFMYDFHFFHHIDSPYITRLRRQFIRQLTVAPPRFVIQVYDDRPWPSGPGTTRDFPELYGFLDAHYRLAHTGATYNILERRTETLAPAATDNDGPSAARTPEGTDAR